MKTRNRWKHTTIPIHCWCIKWWIYIGALFFCSDTFIDRAEMHEAERLSPVRHVVKHHVIPRTRWEIESAFIWHARIMTVISSRDIENVGIRELAKKNNNHTHTYLHLVSSFSVFLNSKRIRCNKYISPKTKQKKSKNPLFAFFFL